MKKNFYKYISLVLVAGLSLSSCNPDLTEVNPNFTTSASYWKNLDETNQGVTALYVTLLNTTIFNVREETVRSDMGYYAATRPYANASVGDQSVKFWTQDFDGDVKAVFQKWDGCYKGIYRANQVIEALNRIQATSEPVRWKQQMAEARFFRGLFHFYLHNSYNNGNVIIVDHTPVTKDDFFASVSPSAKVIEFFRKDLQYAVDNLLPGINAEKGHVNQATAATILGTSYLNEGDDLNLAKFNFNLVIGNSNYSLERDMSKMFTTAGEFNKESIFEVIYDVAVRSDLGLFDEESTTNRLGFLSISTNNMFSPPAWVAYAYKTEKMDLLDSRNYKGGVIQPANLRGVPLRASAMVILAEDLETPVYKFANGIEAAAPNSASPSLNLGLNPIASTAGSFFGNVSLYKKYLNTDQTGYSGENSLPYGSQKSSKNVVVNRLSEVYLMQAEVLIKTGDVPGALKLINKIRERWGLVLLGPAGMGEFAGKTYDISKDFTNPTVLMNQLMFVDKPLELSAEGCSSRFSDLRRWGKLRSRFEELAATKYYVKTFTYTKSTGGTATKTNASVLNAPGTGTTEIPNEFTIPRDRYIISLGKPVTNDYLPIPNSELNRNPNILK
ncbi:RagB/SusD family nutrient uptake outer membrane protein [Flavobacterium ovatum]|uniref:RagB/SusD family nutrient uptake outer membrane protein n=1 Tax=Flavobacterium ovatum TaxID=1928857 RepID=UPI00344ECD65